MTTHTLFALVRLSCITFAFILAAPRANAADVTIDSRTFHLPDGFTLSRVATPPTVERPITADFDEQGRLYVSESSGTPDKLEKQLADKPHRVVRLEDSKGDGRFDKRAVFADRMMFPEGTMWLDGSLYVGAPPSIWKLTDTTGNGVADRRTEWFQGKTLTGCGNDVHGPYAGPDGFIYWCKGAFAEQTYARPGKKPFVTRAAHIFRCRPDGSGIEPVMTGGMDNPVEVAFSPGGERFFTSTFLQNPAGGKRDGIVHAIYGGIYGKVNDVVDDHPHTSPDLMPILVHLGPAAACGLTRYQSEIFGPEFRDNLFATSFNLHKVTRHVLTPDGATFKTRDEDFLVCDSMDFHPTHLIEDADGSLLVIDTGGWYKLCCPTSQLGKPDVLGAIYRIRRTGANAPADPRGLKLAWGELSADALAALLGDPRPAVDRRAIDALGAKGAAAVSAIEHVIARSKSPHARLGAVWSATRIDAPAARRAVGAALKDPDETVRQAAIHSASVWRDRDAMPALLDLLADGTPHNRRAAAEALGRVGDARAVPALLAALALPNDQVLDHSLTYALIEIADAQPTTVGLSSPSSRVRRAAMIALDQMEGGAVSPGPVIAELAAIDPALRATALWVAARHPEWGDAVAGALRGRLAAAGNLNPDERATLRHDLAQMSHAPAVQELLAARLNDATAGLEYRRLTLAAMAEANLVEAPPSWIAAISTALTDREASLLPDAVAAARALRVAKDTSRSMSAPLLAVAGRSDVPPALRLEAVGAIPGGIPQVSPDLFTFLIAQLAPSQPATQRLVAAQALGHAALTGEQLSALADAVKSAGPLEISRLLPAFDQSTDEAVGLKLVEALRDSKAAAGLRADTIKPHLAKFGPKVRQEARPLLARLSPDADRQKAKLENLLATLPKGDVRRGQTVFNSPKVACASCHAIGYVGGTVGPDLTRVGQVRSERDLLESIVFPSASFVQSYEPVMVVTKDGDNQYGIVRRNDAQEVVLVNGPAPEIHVPKSNVKELRPGTVSIMPEGLDQQISPQELADLLAFLKATKW